MEIWELVILKAQILLNKLEFIPQFELFVHCSGSWQWNIDYACNVFTDEAQILNAVLSESSKKAQNNEVYDAIWAKKSTANFMDLREPS